MQKEKRIYIYNDDISFRQCDLFDESNNLIHGDCTNFIPKEENWKTHYYCNQYGIHLQCTKHPEIELNIDSNYSYLSCPKCDNKIKIDNLDQFLKECLKKINYFTLRDAKLIRIDDWYFPEVKEKKEIGSDYWISINVKQDKDHKTIIVVYVGKKGSTDKAQFFIKPEKLNLSSDYNDLDPATILSKIEVTLKDRVIEQRYEK